MCFFLQPVTLNSTWSWVFLIRDILDLLFIISVVRLISFCFILSFFARHSLNQFAFRSWSFSLSYMLLRNYLLSSAFGFSLFIFLIPSFCWETLFGVWTNILLILYWFTLSLYLFSFAVFALSRYFSSSITVLMLLFLYVMLVILPFKFPIFFFSFYLSFLVIFSDAFMVLDFIYFFNPSFPQGFDSFLFLLPKALTSIFLPI